MALAYKEAFVLFLICVGTFAFEDKNDLLHRLEATEKLVASLSERVDLLESREIVHITRISDLESRDIEQQKTIEELQHQLQQKQHDTIKTTLNDPQRQQQLHDSIETTENGSQQQLHDSMATTENGPQQHYTNMSRVPFQVNTLETKQHNASSNPFMQNSTINTELPPQREKLSVHYYINLRRSTWSRSTKDTTYHDISGPCKPPMRQASPGQEKCRSVRSAPRIRQAAVEAPVAFYAMRTSDFTHEGIDQVLIFDNVQTNVGNAYNKHMGMFTAPVDGIYVFSTTMVANGRISAHVSYFKNSIGINNMYVSGVEAAFDATGSTIALSLKKGDIITLRNEDNDASYAGNNHCSFTGFLLYELSTTPVVVG